MTVIIDARGEYYLEYAKKLEVNVDPDKDLKRIAERKDLVKKLRLEELALISALASLSGNHDLSASCIVEQDALRV